MILVAVTSCKQECRIVTNRYSDGEELVVRVYPDCSDTTRYRRIALYPDGKPGSEGFIERGKKNGKFKTWYTNGQLSADWEVVDNLGHGVVNCWYENGQLKSTVRVNMDLQEGPFRQWWDDGKLHAEGEFVKGKQSGVWKYWKQDGRLVQRTYKDGIMHGPTIEVIEGGVKVSGQYANAKEQGKWTWADSLGRLTREVVYEKGEVVSEKEY